MALVEQELTFTTPSALCSLGWRPQLMTGTIVQLLRQHFCAGPLENPVFRRQNAGSSGVNDYVWRPGERTGILLEDQYVWAKTLEEKRPAVLVKRNGWQVHRRGINDLLMGFWNIDGQDRFTTFVEGSHTLFVVAGESGEAENLAYEVFVWLLTFGPVIRYWMQLHRLILTQIDQVTQIPDEATENYVVPITLAYAYEENWTLTQHAPFLKKISIQADLLGLQD